MNVATDHPGLIALEAEVKALKKQILVMWMALKKSANNLDFGGDPTWIDVYCQNLIEQAKKEIENED